MDWPEVTIGDCRLIDADCLDVLPTLAAGSVNAVVTSPPYNQLSSIGPNPSGMWAATTGGAGFVRAITERGYSDDVDEHEYQLRQLEVFRLACIACEDSASLFYNHQMRWRDGEILHPVKWFQPEGWSLKQEIVWDRGGGMMMNARMFCRFDERILWFTRGRHKWNQDSVGMGTIWRIARFQQQQGKEHPVAFPTEVPTRCIAAATDRDDTVCDPFMGSGTTGIACIRTGRKFIGVEVDKNYFATAVKRIEREYAQPNLYKDLPSESEQAELFSE